MYLALIFNMNQNVSLSNIELEMFKRTISFNNSENSYFIFKSVSLLK